MLEQCGLGRWDVFQSSASSGEEVMPGRIDSGCTTPFAVHEYNKALDPLYMHRLETEEVRIMCESHQCVGEFWYVCPGCPSGLLATSKKL